MITKREVLFSIAIICVLLVIGMMISGSIDTMLQSRYQDYNTALQIVDDAEMFGYGMRTSVGNAFVYGDLRTVDPVSIPDIPGEYAYISKIKQRHTMHTRVVTTTDSKGHIHTHTETYWTWDKVQTWSWHCQQISFLGYSFPYGTIKTPDSRYIDTIYESNIIRYEYYACATKYIGTLWARLANNGISETVFYEGKGIDETIDGLESGWEKVVFWIVWVLLMGLAVYGFYYLDNRWLED